MHDQIKLYRYYVPNVNLGGWAVLHLDSAGFFGVTSDYGNYAYQWKNWGDQDFRSFVVSMQPGVDYLAKKLCNGNYVFDTSRTVRLIRDTVTSMRKDDDLSKDDARMEWELANELESENIDFNSWTERTCLSDAWEFYCKSPGLDLLAFCDKSFPRLVELIRQELQSEGIPT